MCVRGMCVCVSVDALLQIPVVPISVRSALFFLTKLTESTFSGRCARQTFVLSQTRIISSEKCK